MLMIPQYSVGGPALAITFHSSKQPEPSISGEPVVTRKLWQTGRSEPYVKYGNPVPHPSAQVASQNRAFPDSFRGGGEEGRRAPRFNIQCPSRGVTVTVTEIQDLR